MPKLYRITWMTLTGISYVKANSPEEAIELANHDKDVGYQSQDEYEAEATHAEEETDEDTIKEVEEGYFPDDGEEY